MEIKNKSMFIGIVCLLAIFFSVYFVFAVNVSPLTNSVNWNLLTPYII